MRLAALTGSLSRLAGGTFTSIRRPLQEMVRQFGTELRVFGIQDRFTTEDLPRWSPLEARAFPIRGLRAFGWAPEMAPAVVQFRPEVIQVHGIWMHFSVVNSNVHRRFGTPYVVHLHGMLDPWAVRGSSIKKRFAGWLYENRHLREAGCLRALCEPEVRAIRAYGLEGRVCLVPNGIDLPSESPAGPAPWRAVVEPGKKVLLFLGRIHAKKGLPNLLRAWSALKAAGLSLAKDWHLVIAGWDTTDHQPELQRLVHELHLEHEVTFLGPLFEEAKEEAYRNAAAVVLPSWSEGLPISILEAWAYRLPVMMTPHCNLPEGFAVRAAIRVETEPGSIEEGLRELVGMRDGERSAMGSRGRALVHERFRWDVIARQLHSVNSWVLGGGAPPECVL